MEFLTIIEASKHSKLSRRTIEANKEKLGFFQPLGLKKWLVDKKVLEERIKSYDNSDRLASKQEVICRSKSVMKSGTLTSSRQTAQELGALLARRTKRKQPSTMTS